LFKRKIIKIAPPKRGALKKKKMNEEQKAFSSFLIICSKKI